MKYIEFSFLLSFKRRKKSKINIEELIRKNPMVGIFGLEALKLKSNV